MSETRVLTAFVCMSFSAEHKNTYELAIKEACRSCKVVCRRLDEAFMGAVNLIDEMHNEIHRADIIIADLSGLSPNVLYEVGYSFGIKKQVIMLTDDINENPFNLGPIGRIVFNKHDLQGLKKVLIEKLKFFVKQAQFLPGQNKAQITPQDDEAPLVLTGWNKWGGISVFTDENTLVLQGKINTAGYACDTLDRELAGKTLVLHINGTNSSQFSMNRLLKMTVNIQDALLTPANIPQLISHEYIPAGDGQVEYVIPEQFDGKLGFVFYEADLNFLRISVFVRDREK